MQQPVSNKLDVLTHQLSIHANQGHLQDQHSSLDPITSCSTYTRGSNVAVPAMGVG